MLSNQVDIDAVCRRAEALCRRIAPLDLGNTPLYIVPQSRLPDELGGKAVCDGFTSPSLDLYLKDIIGPAWRGRGACMVINDTDFCHMDAMDIELAVLAITLHELAHIVDRPTVYRDRQGENPMRIEFEALCVGYEMSRDPPPAEIAAPFQGHGLRFVRAALHLRHRAEAVGAPVSLFCYCAGNKDGLSHPSRYREALGDEPARLADMSIRDILDVPYPEAFWCLWTADMAHWLSVCSPSSERSLSPCLSLP